MINRIFGRLLLSGIFEERCVRSDWATSPSAAAAFVILLAFLEILDIIITCYLLWEVGSVGFEIPVVWWAAQCDA
jgi:hypothetical protein